VDAVRTASVAASLAIDALLGREVGNPLVSWKGDAGFFEDAGFKVSERYALSADELDQQRNGYHVATCAVCGQQARSAA
jgi:hypothetical protein